MEYFLAVSDKQLGLCLRMLYAEGIRAIVETVRNSKGKIEFHIKANTDEALLKIRFSVHQCRRIENLPFGTPPHRLLSKHRLRRHKRSGRVLDEVPDGLRGAGWDGELAVE